MLNDTVINLRANFGGCWCLGQGQGHSLRRSRGGAHSCGARGENRLCAASVRSCTVQGQDADPRSAGLSSPGRPTEH